MSDEGLWALSAMLIVSLLAFGWGVWEIKLGLREVADRLDAWRQETQDESLRARAARASREERWLALAEERQRLLTRLTALTNRIQALENTVAELDDADTGVNY